MGKSLSPREALEYTLRKAIKKYRKLSDQILLFEMKIVELHGVRQKNIILAIKVLNC